MGSIWRACNMGEGIREDVDFRMVSEEFLANRGVIRTFCPKCDCCILYPKTRTFPVLRCPECALPHEKELCEWLLYVNPYNKVFERCMTCGRTTWMQASLKGNIVEFTCENCHAKFNLDVSEHLLIPSEKKRK